MERPFEHSSLPLDQGEVAQVFAILNRETWVKSVRYPGTRPGEMGVDCFDGRSWRIAKPRDLVRLKYHYYRTN